MRDTVDHAQRVALIELSSAIDNPVITLDGRVESNGNFHGAPLGYVLDFLAIAVADLASISERRTDRFLDRARSSGLNAFLAADPGVDSGHMIVQYTQAAIVSELKRLAAPASLTRFPARRCKRTTFPWGGRRREAAAWNRWADASACHRAADRRRGIEQRLPLQPGPATAAALSALRGAGARGSRRRSLARTRDRDRCRARSQRGGRRCRRVSDRLAQLINNHRAASGGSARAAPMNKETLGMEGARPVRALRGTTLTARPGPPRPRCGC